MSRNEPEDALNCIRTVHLGKSFFPTSVAAKLAEPGRERSLRNSVGFDQRDTGGVALAADDRSVVPGRKERDDR